MAGEGRKRSGGSEVLNLRKSLKVQSVVKTLLFVFDWSPAYVCSTVAKPSGRQAGRMEWGEGEVGCGPKWLYLSLYYISATTCRPTTVDCTNMYWFVFSSVRIFQEEVVAAAVAEVVTRPGGQAGREAAAKEELWQAIESEYSLWCGLKGLTILWKIYPS